MVFAVPIGRSLACLPLPAAGVLRSTNTANTTPAGKQEEQEEAAEEVGGSSGVKKKSWVQLLFNMSSPKTFARNLQGQLKFYIYHNVLLLLMFPPLTSPPRPVLQPPRLR